MDFHDEEFRDSMEGPNEGKDEPKTPKISKSLNIMKWSKAFREILHRCIGVHNIPIVYVIREEAPVPAAVPALMAGQPHSTEAGSVEWN
jgi:hypothetical protein